MTNGGGDGLMPPEAMAQMFDALTLRNMINPLAARRSRKS